MATKKTAGAEETVQLTVRLPRSEWRKLKYLAVDQDTSIQALLVDAIRNLLKASKR